MLLIGDPFLALFVLVTFVLTVFFGLFSRFGSRPFRGRHFSRKVFTLEIWPFARVSEVTKRSSFCFLVKSAKKPVFIDTVFFYAKGGAFLVP